VEGWGGCVQVISTTGARGTTFKIVMPRKATLVA
jgi:hypothetical protein